MDRNVNWLRYELKTLVAQRPILALPVARRRGHGVLLSAETEVLIEGYPRSANSFSVAAFELAQGRKVRIAHHLHAPAHVIAATRAGVPALVLIRDPDDSVLEFVIAKPQVGIASALRGYVRFYAPLARYRDAFVVGRFSEVTSNFGTVMRRVNERFGTSFEEFEHTDENVRICFEAMERYWEGQIGHGPQLERVVGRPSELRERLKAELRERYEAPELSRLRERARSLYATFGREARDGRPSRVGLRTVSGAMRLGREAARGALFEAKTVVAQHPSLALPIASRRHGVPVGRDTEIVIEGFPRSGTSFAIAAFDMAQERRVKVACHVHAPAQVIAAARRGLPALVVVREPEDTVLSFVIRNPHISVAQALRGYLRFYVPLLRSRELFVVGLFPDVTSDFGAVTRRVNERFGRSFREFEHTEENVAAVFAAIDEDYRRRVVGEALERSVARPSELRRRIKEELRGEYAAAGVARLRARAEAAYEAYASGSHAPHR